MNKTILGAITVQELRTLMKGKSRGSLIYIVEQDNNLYLETTTPIKSGEALEIISSIIDKREEPETMFKIPR